MTHVFPARRASVLRRLSGAGARRLCTAPRRCGARADHHRRAGCDRRNRRRRRGAVVRERAGTIASGDLDFWLDFGRAGSCRRAAEARGGAAGCGALAGARALATGGGIMATLVLTAVGTAIGGPIGGALGGLLGQAIDRSEEHTSELPALMRTSYAVFCLNKNTHENSRQI